nr:restriction endonuclease subunit S [Rhodococcus sp. GA1]
MTFKPTDVVEPGTPNTVACMRTKNVQEELDLSDVWHIDSSFVKRPEQFLHAGDLLISSANSWNLVGKCSWVPELDGRSTFGGFVSALRPDRAKVDPRYLYRFFSSARTQAVVRSYARQTTNISNLDLKRCAELPIPVPPLEEQRRIASILDHAETLCAKRREAIARLDELTRSIFIDMFGEAWDTWELSTVEEIAAPHKGSIRTGPFGSQLLHEEFTDSGIPVLGIDNAVSNEFEWGKRRYISEEKYRALERYTVHPGDVLITIMGTCGRCAIVPQDIPLAINTKHLCCVTLDREKALPEFLHSYFLHDPEAQSYLRRTAKGAIMSGLNMGIIKKLPVPLVPLDLQRIFIQRVEHVKLLKSQQMRQLEDLDAAFVSIQSRAFLGEL